MKGRVKMDIKEIFWSNVFWHIEQKGLSPRDVIGRTHREAKKGCLNVSLNEVARIACKLDVDDYTILFEEV